MRHFGGNFTTATDILAQLDENPLAIDPQAAGRLFVLHRGIDVIAEGELQPAGAVHFGPPVDFLGLSLADPGRIVAISEGAHYRRGPDGRWRPAGEDAVRLPAFRAREWRPGVWARDPLGFDQLPDAAHDFLRVGLGPPQIALGPRNPRVQYYGMAGHLLKSTDGGQNWVDLGMNPMGAYTRLLLNPLRPRVVYAGSRDHRLYRTTAGHRRLLPAARNAGDDGHPQGHAAALSATAAVSAYQPRVPGDGSDGLGEPAVRSPGGIVLDDLDSVRPPGVLASVSAARTQAPTA